MFKKFIMYIAACSFLFGSVSNAQFVDEEVAVISVEQAKKVSNDTWVVLEGFIVKRQESDKYVFEDVTGSIRIIVRNSSWQGIEVSPQTKIRISGQVDKPFFFLPKRTIKVNKVELAQK